MTMTGMRLYTILLMAMLLATACKEKDYFDKDVYDEMTGEAFPVEGVDNGQNWKAVGTAATDIHVGRDFTGPCEVVVYIPQSEAVPNAIRVVRATVSPGQRLCTAFSYPMGTQTFYVCVTGADGTRVIKRSVMVDNKIGSTLLASEAPGDEGTTSVLPAGMKDFSIRYLFEDDFPLQGDYDFNDIVLTATPIIDGNKVTLTVSLDAVGTFRQVAAAMRIRGLRREDITEALVEGDFDFYNGKPVSSFAIIDSKEFVLPDNLIHTPDVTFNFFSDAHWAMVQTIETNGNVRRWRYNTVERNSRGDDYADAAAPTVTYRLTLASADAANRFVAENMDAFIVCSTFGSYTETHTKPFKATEVIYNYLSDPEAYNSAYVWALQVPGTTKWPREGEIGRAHV